MIIWRGWGFLVAVAGFVGLLLAELITRAVTHDNGFYQAHALPRLMGAVLASAFVFVVAKFLDSKDQPKVLIDKETGKEVVLQRRNALFFIPVKYWPYITLGIGAILAFVPET